MNSIPVFGDLVSFYPCGNSKQGVRFSLFQGSVELYTRLSGDSNLIVTQKYCNSIPCQLNLLNNMEKAHGLLLTEAKTNQKLLSDKKFCVS